MNCGYDIKAVLEIIFKVTKKNADILAHTYLLKDKSIISKWRNNKAIPRNDDISKIVEFVINESTLSQQKIIRDNIEKLIEREPIKEDLKNIILNTSDFAKFLQEALSVSVSISEDDIEPQNIKERKSSQSNSFAGHIKNKNRNRSYSGIIEFDLVMPQESGEKHINISSDSGMEFEGKVNIAPKNPLVRASKYSKKAQVMGILFIIGISMVVFAASHSSDTQRKDLKVLSNKNSSGLSMVQNSVYSPTPEAKPTPAHSTRPSSVIPPKNSTAPTPAKSTQNSGKKTVTNKINNTATSTTVNNTTNKTTIINSGDNAVIVQGNQISVGF